MTFAALPSLYLSVKTVSGTGAPGLRSSVSRCIITRAIKLKQQQHPVKYFTSLRLKMSLPRVTLESTRWTRVRCHAHVRDTIIGHRCHVPMSLYTQSSVTKLWFSLRLSSSWLASRPDSHWTWWSSRRCNSDGWCSPCIPSRTWNVICVGSYHLILGCLSIHLSYSFWEAGFSKL